MTVLAEHPASEIGPIAGGLPGFFEGSIAVLAVGLSVLMTWVRADIVLLSLAMAVAVGALVVWIAWQDLRTFTIPDGAIVALAALAIGYRWSLAMQAGDTPLETGADIAFDALLPGGVLLAFRELYFRRRGFDGLGLGDVKLAAAGALLVGTIGFSWALFGASLAGLVSVGVRRHVSRSVARPKPIGMDRIAFGALLAPAFWIVWITQKLAVLLPFAWR